VVINDVIKITDNIRGQISDIFSAQYLQSEKNISEYMTYVDRSTPGNFKYTNYFTTNHLNIVRGPEGNAMMGVFNFDIKNTVKLLRLLKLELFKPQLNGIRVYPNTDVPMHMDLNRGSIGRENPVYSIMLTGKEAMVFFSNRNDGSRLAAIPALGDFIMYPTQIQHGALTKEEPLDVLQIRLEDMY